MFDTLTQKLESVLKRLRGEGRISEANIAETLREVRKVLLDADVNYKVVKHFISAVQQKSLGQEVVSSIAPGHLIVKIIHDELVGLMGTAKADIPLPQTPPSILIL